MNLRNICDALCLSILFTSNVFLTIDARIDGIAYTPCLLCIIIIHCCIYSSFVILTPSILAKQQFCILWLLTIYKPTFHGLVLVSIMRREIRMVILMTSNQKWKKWSSKNDHFETQKCHFWAFLASFKIFIFQLTAP